MAQPQLEGVVALSRMRDSDVKCTQIFMPWSGF
jgi:hypothetical protein